MQLETHWRNVSRDDAAAAVAPDYRTHIGVKSVLSYIQRTRGTYATSHDGSLLVRFDTRENSWQLGRIIRPLSWTRASAAAAAILTVVAFTIWWGAFDLALRGGW